MPYPWSAGQSVNAADLNTMFKFGGNGSDGALTVSSGVTTINLGGAAVVIKNYSSISITGTGSVAFSNPNANGTKITFLCQGNAVLTSSANPLIDLRGLGGGGGAGNNANSNGVTATNGSENIDYNIAVMSSGKYGAGASSGSPSCSRGGGGGSNYTAGTVGASSGGAAGTPLSGMFKSLFAAQHYIGIKLLSGGGGGGGGVANANLFPGQFLGTNGGGGTAASPTGGNGGNAVGAGSSNGVVGGSGGGGAGGGEFYMEVAGSLNFTGIISAAGSNGGNGGNASGGSNFWIGGAGGGRRGRWHNYYSL